MSEPIRQPLWELYGFMTYKLQTWEPTLFTTTMYAPKTILS